MKQLADVIMDKTGIHNGLSPDGAERFLLFYGAKCSLGNFYYAPFYVDGIRFQNTEQYFHYRKAGKKPNIYTCRYIHNAYFKNILMILILCTAY